MSKNTPGWAVELTGDKIDLDDLREMLAPPFDPWLEIFTTDDGLKTILRSGDWSNLTDAGDVFRDASRIIERLNGEALLIHIDAKPVGLGQTLKFGADGIRLPILFAATARINVTLGRVRGRARLTGGGPEKPPEESKMQRWFREAEGDETRSELFAHVSRSDNWFDLYKSMELLRKLVSDQLISKALGTDYQEWRDVWQTANCYRHAPDLKKYPLPANPPVLERAREFVLKAIPRAL